MGSVRLTSNAKGMQLDASKVPDSVPATALTSGASD